MDGIRVQLLLPSGLNLGAEEDKERGRVNDHNYRPATHTSLGPRLTAAHLVPLNLRKCSAFQCISIVF